MSYVHDLVVTKTPKGAETIDMQGTVASEIAEHYKKGNYYCELRANKNTVYDAEFNEERWECMLQLALTASVMVSMKTPPITVTLLTMLLA